MSNEHSTRPANSDTATPDPLAAGDMFAYLRLIRDADLTSPARLVLHVMAGYADADGGNVRPTVATLAADTGLSERTVKKATRELRAAGWLDVQSAGGCFDGKNRATLYRLAVGAARPSTDGVHQVHPVQEVHPRGAGGAPRGVQEVHPGGAPGAYYQPTNQPTNQPRDLPLNTSDAPPRRALAIADATEGAPARAVSESDRDSNSAATNTDHGPCATCGKGPGRVEVLWNPRSGKAHMLDALSAAQIKVYTNATVVHYCLTCAHRAPKRGWWTHTPERVA